MADRIGKEYQPESEEEKEAKKRLMKIQEQIEEIIKANEVDYTFLIAIHEDKTKYTVYTGNGCPVCMTSRCMHWVIENDLRHEDGEPAIPNMIAIDLGALFSKTKKKDIH